MPLPLAMCPARAGNEFSYWTNGWQRDKPWLSGVGVGVGGRVGIAHPSGKTVASYSAASFVRRLKILKVFQGQSIKKPLLFHTLGVPKTHLSPGKESLITWVSKPSPWPHITAVLNDGRRGT